MVDFRLNGIARIVAPEERLALTRAQRAGEQGRVGAKRDPGRIGHIAAYDAEYPDTQLSASCLILGGWHGHNLDLNL